MSKEDIRITIEAWCADNDFSATTEQIEDLIEGIEITNEQNTHGLGGPVCDLRYQTAQRERAVLRQKVDLLQAFIAWKGYPVDFCRGKHGIALKFTGDFGVFESYEV